MHLTCPFESIHLLHEIFIKPFFFFFFFIFFVIFISISTRKSWFSKRFPSPTFLAFPGWKHDWMHCGYEDQRLRSTCPNAGEWMQYQGRQTSLLRVPRNRSAALGDIQLLLRRNPLLSLWLGWQVSFDQESVILHWLQHSNFDWNVFSLQIISRWTLSQIFVEENLQEVERLHWCIDWWHMSRPHATEAMFSIWIQLWRLFHVLQT